jgi:hypothetical protein
VLCRRGPFLDDLIEFVRSDVRVPGAHDFNKRFSTAREGGFKIPREDRLEWFLFLPLRVLRSEFLNTVDAEKELKVQRLLGPECSVVIECSNTFGLGHKIGRARLCDLSYKVDDGFLRLALVPRRQPVGGLRDGRRDSQGAKERGGDDGICVFDLHNKSTS